MKFNRLSAEEIRIIENKGTELPFSGRYNNFYQDGIIYVRGVTTLYFTPKISSTPTLLAKF